MLVDFIRLLPIRVLRLVSHFLFFIPFRKKPRVCGIVDWVSDLLFFVFDLLGIPELYQVGYLLVKPNIRLMNIEERIVAEEMYQGCIWLDKVWINEEARTFTKSYAFAYVTPNIVNYWKDIEEGVFVHELMHVAQYHQYGSVYIVRALRAQQSKEGYDYGGSFGLSKALALGKKFVDFNFEQQAQIIEDYYKAKNRPDLLLNPFITNIYGTYYDQMRQFFKL